MTKHRQLTVLFLGLLLIWMSPICASELSQLSQQVKDTERAFAQTMADRDFEAFKVFLDDETVFFARGEPLPGKQAVAGEWEAFFSDPEAPFSWEPETVAVLESGTLALSSGPVRNSAGEQFATFNSIWRKNKEGAWRIVFDKGYRYCEPPAPENGD